jgi:hypothetical protein
VVDEERPLLLFIWFALLAFMSGLSAKMVRADPTRNTCRAWRSVLSPRPEEW